METIKSLENTEFETLFAAFNEAFIDYELQINRQELKVMLARRGFVPELSFGAFDNNKLVSFTLNGIGLFEGIKTAYDTGTGTLKEYRGKGLASRIFSFSIPVLQQAGINQYVLEVLQHNTKAVSVYQKLGFTVRREFNYFVQNSGEISTKKTENQSKYTLKPIELHEIEQLKIIDFQDFNPSWQNSFEAIKRKPEDFLITGAFENKVLIGYSILEPTSGDITQLAISKQHRRNGVASYLLAEMLKQNRHHALKCINTETSCESIKGFLESANITLKGKQFEMIKHF